MTLLTIWPYLLMIPALLLGIILGWQLQRVRQQRNTSRAASPSSPASRAHARLSGQHDNLEDAQAELDYLERQLVSMNNAVAKARQQLKDLDSEHGHLQQEIEQHQSGKAPLPSSQQDRRAAVLEDIDASGAEVDRLERMRDTYAQRISQLMQTIVEQVVTLNSMRETCRTNEEETVNLRREIDQYDVRLKELLKEHERRQADLAYIGEQLSHLDQQRRASIAPGAPRLQDGEGGRTHSE